MSPSPPRSLAVRGICQALSTAPGQGSGRRQTTFYGSGFIADQTGAVLAKAGREGQEVVLASFKAGCDCGFARHMGPVPGGLFRDRRPETYAAVGTMGGGR